MTDAVTSDLRDLIARCKRRPVNMAVFVDREDWFALLDAAEASLTARNAALEEGQIAAIIKGIENDVTDRRGFRHVWDNLDEDVIADIKACWRESIVRALKEPT